MSNLIKDLKKLEVTHMAKVIDSCLAPLGQSTNYNVIPDYISVTEGTIVGLIDTLKESSLIRVYVKNADVYHVARIKRNNLEAID